MKLKPAALFSMVAVVFFAVFVYEAHEWRLQARLYPWAIGIPMLVLAIVQVIMDLRGYEAKESSDGAPVDFQFAQQADPEAAKKRTIIMFLWLLGFFFAVVLFGFSIAIPAMVFGYTYIQSKEPLVLCLCLTVGAWVFFWGLFVKLLTLPFPDGLVFSFLGLT